VLCGSNEFDRLEVTGTMEGVQIKNMPQCEVARVNFYI